MKSTLHSFIPLVVGGFLALGLGLGLGVASSGKPFVIEAINTPIGSFVLRGNFQPSELPSSEQQMEKHWLDHIA